MGAFQEYVKSAIASIRGNKVRSLLTMLGIIIGITSVLIILVVGDGVEAQMKQELNKSVATVVVKVVPTKTDKHITREAYQAMLDTFRNDVYGIDVTMEYYGETIDFRGKTRDFMTYGRSACAPKAFDYAMAHGRYFSEEDVRDGNMVCVLSECNAKALYGYENVVGEPLIFNFEGRSYELTVVGVRKDKEDDVLMLDVIELFMLDMPYTTLCYVSNKNPDEEIDSIKLICDGTKKDELSLKAPSALENLLELRGEKAIKLDKSTSFDATGKIVSMIKSVVILIAAISLVVGGIGVMNIMTVSVTERTREIGIRKSLGARTSSVMVQFLSEAAILTAIGGFVGLVLGVGAAYIITVVAKMPFVVNFSAIAIVVGISVFIGLFFGIAPALKAAKLNPIDALHMD